MEEVRYPGSLLLHRAMELEQPGPSVGLEQPCWASC